MPPAYRWLTYFNLPNDDNQYFVGMDSSEGVPPVFNYGTRTTIDLPEAPVGDYQVLGSLNAASHYDADGTITLVLDKSALNIQPGMVLTNIATSIRQSSPSSAGAVGLTVDSAASIGSYTVVGNQCVETGGNTGGNTGGDGGEPPVTGTGGNARFGGAVGATLFLPLLGAAALRRRRSFLDQQALRNT